MEVHERRQKFKMLGLWRKLPGLDPQLCHSLDVWPWAMSPERAGHF